MFGRSCAELRTWYTKGAASKKKKKKRSPLILYHDTGVFVKSFLRNFFKKFLPKRLIFGVKCGIIIIEKMREEYISPQIQKVFKKDLQFGFDYDIIYIEKLRKLLNLFKKNERHSIFHR